MPWEAPEPFPAEPAQPSLKRTPCPLSRNGMEAESPGAASWWVSLGEAGREGGQSSPDSLEVMLACGPGVEGCCVEAG